MAHYLNEIEREIEAIREEVVTLIARAESAETQLAAIRSAVGAEERCVWTNPVTGQYPDATKGQRCGARREDHFEHSAHQFVEEPTLSAVRRVVAERLSEGAIQRLVPEIVKLSPYACDMTPYEQQIAEKATAELIRQARGKE